MFGYNLTGQTLLQGLDVIIYDETLIEPTDRSFHQAIRFAEEAKVDGFVSLGGGSVMDTCKVSP